MIIEICIDFNNAARKRQNDTLTRNLQRPYRFALPKLSAL
jgi:hypothetical protein